MFNSKVYKIAKRVEKKLTNQNKYTRIAAGHENFVTEIDLENFEEYVFQKIKPELEKKWGQKVDYRNIDISLSKSDIKWNLDLDLRNWGVKFLDVFCPNQKIHISGKIEESEENKSFDIEIDLELKDVQIEKPTNFCFQISAKKLNLYKNKFSLEF